LGLLRVQYFCPDQPAIGKAAQQIAATANKFLALLDDAQRAESRL